MSQPSELAYALEKLKEHGFKYTKRREEMLYFLLQENRYTGAKEVYDFMSAQYAGISYDTIYRNLHDFGELNLLEETELNGERKFRFRCCPNHGHHHHFICTNCGATREVHMCPMDFFEEQLPDCEISGHRFEIFGKCADCLKKERVSA